VKRYRKIMLERPEEAGVYEIPATRVGPICEAGGAAGLRCVRLDLSARCGKAGLLDGLSEAFGFPAWFGRNWDALADCLDDLGWLPEGGHVLVLENAAAFRAAWPDDYRTGLEILSHAARAWGERGVPFWVFTVLPGRTKPR
jgi:hypothetical protein